MSESANLAGREQPAAATATVPQMDRAFIARNQIVERYFANQLPAKGALDFERYCRENPEILDELRVAERVHAGVRLMEAGGVSLPWEVRPRRFWEQLPVIIAIALIAVVASTAAVSLRGRLGASDAANAALRSRLAAQPLDPVQSTRSMKIELNRDGPSRTPALTIASARAELAELKLQLASSAFQQYRLTIDRVDQGRVMVLSGLQRDSNGEVHLAINTRLLGPGAYQFFVEGINPRGEYTPQGWITIAFVR